MIRLYFDFLGDGPRTFAGFCVSRAAHRHRPLFWLLGAGGHQHHRVFLYYTSRSKPLTFRGSRAKKKKGFVDDLVCSCRRPDTKKIHPSASGEFPFSSSFFFLFLSSFFFPS